MNSRALLGPLALVAGCLTYEPLPPLSARIDGIGPCVGCRTPGALVVTVTGDDAIPHATVVVRDTRVRLALGQHPASAARADGSGRWKVSLRALTVPGHEELPVLAGDVLEVFQKKNPDGEASAVYRLVVTPPGGLEPEVPVIAPPGQSSAPPGTVSPSAEGP